jgi:hypothetical protein
MFWDSYSTALVKLLVIQSARESTPASRIAARVGLCGFPRAHERADELVLHLWSDSVGVNARRAQEFSCVLDVIDARLFHIDRFQSSRRELLPIVAVRKSTGHTTHPQFQALANFRRNLVANNDIGDCEPPAGRGRCSQSAGATIADAWLTTINEKWEVLQEASVCVQNDRIAAVGTRRDLPRKFPEAELVDCRAAS